MNNINILNYKDIDVNEIKFSSPEKVKGGSYISVPKYNNEPIYIQTPRLINKGITKSEQRCSIELELDNTHLNFYEFITNVDDFNIVEIQKNSLEWFKTEFPLDVVEEFYKSPVKMARSKKAPSLKVKVPLSRGSIDCNIYNNDNQLINYSQIKENSKVLTVLHFYGLRFLKQQVICEWVPLQIKVFDCAISSGQKYMIDDSLLSDYEDNNEENNQDDEYNEENNQDNQSNIENTENNLDNQSNSENIENNQSNSENTENNLDNQSNSENIENNQSNSENTENSENIEDNQSNNESTILTQENLLDSNVKLYDNNLNLGELDLLKEEKLEKVSYEQLEKKIIEKNERIEFLENKIRELFKYLNTN